MDDDERNAQDLADKILKKILDDDERNEVKRKENKSEKESEYYFDNGFMHNTGEQLCESR